MSALLDVLQKRRAPSPAPTNSDELVAARDPVPAVPQAAEGALPELQLAPETAAAADEEPAMPPGIQAAAPQPEPPAAPVGSGPGTRRWSDPAVVPAETIPVAESPSSAKASVAPAAQSEWRARMPLILTVVSAIVAATLWLGYQMVGSSDSSFAGDPALMAAVEEPVAEPAASDAEPAAPTATATRKRRPVVAEPAWYDVPALPEEPMTTATPVITITRGSNSDPLFEKVNAAYAALTSNDNASAEALYREVLATDAASVDALLGLGALAVRGGRFDEARGHYQRVQQLDPRNSTALAGLTALPGASEQTGATSRLKNLLRDQPSSAPLHFALGLQHAAAGDWPDAQLSFFEAVRHAPTNADYAFNLAVSLDRLGQSQPAVSYYQRALDLAVGGHQFDMDEVSARIATLGAAQG